MKTVILKIKGTWDEVLNDCRMTVGKQPLEKEPSQAFKRGILLAEHSPIRDISVKWVWKDIKSWVATHWVRHRWECRVKSQRTDRTGVDRDKLTQDALVDFIGEANAQHLIDTMRKRLCRQAAKETREYAEDFKEALAALEPEIADVLVPNCVYRGFCPEMNGCGFWEMFSEVWGKEEMCSRKRYELYNKWFARRKGE